LGGLVGFYVAPGEQRLRAVSESESSADVAV
jgi:hypothetical protein